MAKVAREADLLRVVPASEILVKIEKGEPVKYDHVRIIGDLDIYRLYVFSWDGIPGEDNGRLIEYITQRFGIDWVKTAKIEKIDDGKTIRVSDEKNFISLKLNDKKCEVILEIEVGRTDKFIAMIENDELSIYRKLNLPIDQGRVLIVPPIEIVSSIFDGTVNFWGSNFQNIINFSNSKFTGSASFIDSIFTRGVNFIGSHFDSSAHFYGSHFREHVAFMGAQFRGLATFYDSMFKDDTYFIKSLFNEDALFEGSDFFKAAEFSSSKFSEKAIFKSTKFRRDAKFIASKFEGFANFEFCSFDKSLNLEGASIATMFLQNVTFETDSRILLKYSEFSRLEVFWKLIRNRLEYDGSVYLALVKNYNNLEWFDDADECNYQYRTIRRKEHLQGSKWIIDLIPWWFYGYGVRFYYPLLWMIGIIVLSAGVYMWGGQAQYPGAFGLSTVILTTTTQIGNLAGPCWIMSIIERIVGWLLMSTFLVALAKKTLR